MDVRYDVTVYIPKKFSATRRDIGAEEADAIKQGAEKKGWVVTITEHAKSGNGRYR